VAAIVANSRVLAWGVHAYTASGAVLAYLTVTAVVSGEYRTAFLWMLLATLIDATDGWMARAARVKDVLPRVNGARLDDIVDYLTFVFAPAFLIERAGLVGDLEGRVAVAAILLSSAYGFSQEDAKTADHFFTGFPSYWNIVAFYLFAAALPPGVNAAILIALAILVFVPIRYVYPSRTPTLRTVTLTLGIAWGAMLAVLVMGLPSVSRVWLVVSLMYPIYYVVLSLWLQRRRAMLAPFNTNEAS
jgi:phosphatidylcholine synthase